MTEQHKKTISSIAAVAAFIGLLGFFIPMMAGASDKTILSREEAEKLQKESIFKQMPETKVMIPSAILLVVSLVTLLLLSKSESK